jgi:hypothetical protein
MLVNLDDPDLLPDEVPDLGLAAHGDPKLFAFETERDEGGFVWNRRGVQSRICVRRPFRRRLP